jgi:hypothetical protein
MSSPSGRVRLYAIRTIMGRSPEYKRTLFDRHGPDGSQWLRAGGYALLVAGLTSAVLLLELGRHPWVFAVGAAVGVVTALATLLVARLAGGAWRHFLMGGSSTPYREQFSALDSLVMRGRADEALASLERLLLEQPTAVDVRIKAAELYARERHEYRRAAELFWEAQKLPSITSGQDVYVTNRLVDLLTGPLEVPGRSLVELRRLIERHDGTSAADSARAALRTIKARLNAGTDSDLDGSDPNPG